MKRSWMPLLFAAVLFAAAVDAHAQLELAPRPEPCANCQSAPSGEGSTYTVTRYLVKTIGRTPPPLVLYPRVPGPTVGQYAPPAAGQPRTGPGTPACQSAVELRSWATNLGMSVDPEVVYVTEKLVWDGCHSTSSASGDVVYDAVTYYELAYDEDIYTDFEDSLRLMALILDDAEHGIYHSF